MKELIMIRELYTRSEEKLPTLPWLFRAQSNVTVTDNNKHFLTYSKLKCLVPAPSVSCSMFTACINTQMETARTGPTGPTGNHVQ